MSRERREGGWKKEEVREKQFTHPMEANIEHSEKDQKWINEALSSWFTSYKPRRVIVESSLNGDELGVY